jgi:hypothetical protein
MTDVLGALGDLGSVLRARAHSLRDAAAVAEAAAGAMRWTGQRADASRTLIRERRRDAEALAWEYEQLAHSVDNVGTDYRHAIQLMHRYEADVRAWLSRAPAEVAHGLLSAGALPPSGSAQWKAVIDRVRSVGAAL